MECHKTKYIANPHNKEAVLKTTKNIPIKNSSFIGLIFNSFFNTNMRLKAAEIIPLISNPTLNTEIGIE